MTTGVIASPPFLQFILNNGLLAVNGSILTQVGGVNAATFSDVGLTTPLPNPIPLNSRGEISDSAGNSKQLFLTPNTVYTLTLFDGPNGTGNQVWQANYVNGIQVSGESTAPLLAAVVDTPILASLVRTPSEIAAGVTPTNYAYAPGNLLRYGADPTGVATSDTAMTRALAVCAASAQNGGRIYLPATNVFYLFANPWNLNQLSGITIYGDGSCTAGAGPATVVKYSGTGSTHFIQLTSAFGCKIQGMQIVNTSGFFTGAMVRCGNDGVMGHLDSTFCAVQDVTFNATTSCYHLDLEKCIEFAAERCNFVGGAVSVKGQNSAGTSYANVISFYKCQWAQTVAAPVNYGGQAWSFDKCTFEGLSNGQAGAFNTISTARTIGISFRDCWFGDVSVTGGTWITIYGADLEFSGNYITGVTAASTYAISLFGVNGVSIHANDFENFTGAINFGGATCSGVVIQANTFVLCTNILVNPGNADVSSVVNPNVPLIPGNGRFYFFGASGAGGWEYGPNGTLELMGAANITSGTPVAISFAGLGLPAFTTSIFAPPQLSISPGTVGNVPYIVSGTVATTGFTLNCSGSGANVVYWRCKGI